jgi:hypothetical protein
MYRANNLFNTWQIPVIKKVADKDKVTSVPKDYAMQCKGGKAPCTIDLNIKGWIATFMFWLFNL